MTGSRQGRTSESLVERAHRGHVSAHLTLVGGRVETDACVGVTGRLGVLIARCGAGRRASRSVADESRTSMPASYGWYSYRKLVTARAPVRRLPCPRAAFGTLTA